MLQFHDVLSELLLKKLVSGIDPGSAMPQTMHFTSRSVVGSQFFGTDWHIGQSVPNPRRNISCFHSLFFFFKDRVVGVQKSSKVARNGV